jgi:glycosyltransferase involved in cell wall biosynthesis
MISIVVPCFNTPRQHLLSVYESAARQTYENFELIFVDDCSRIQYYPDLPRDQRVRVIYKDTNTGPADSRNVGARSAAHDIIFFTDSDCRLDCNTLQVVADSMAQEDILAGDTVTEATTLLGRLVAQLGFPGGGGIGFENVWKVDPQGYTTSISSCNLAIRKDAFFKIGLFDSTFPVAGGEDTVFAKAAIGHAFRIKYVKQQRVYHVEAENFKRFLAWQVTRGRGNYHIKRRLGRVGGFLLLRLWSFKNSLMRAGVWAPVTLLLIVLAVVFQAHGYRIEKKKNAAL